MKQDAHFLLFFLSIFLPIFLFMFALDLTSSRLVAATMACETAPDEDLKVRISAQVDDSALLGQEITQLRQLTVAAGIAQSTFENIQNDKVYRPRMNLNRNRFLFEGIDASSDRFDGIVHGVILPKILGSQDITSTDEAGLSFKAKVISSTDSYHDGIMSYFPLSCRLSH
ncbi:MAG: hypothetical protein NTV34_10995 [Proteobacteria bacterium]|nr:hypothetical protein [Pseudomonadota bacterium]